MSGKAESGRTQSQRSAATKEALIRAARPLFATEGFAAVGTEAIVRAAGVTRGALYHQFIDKTELFAAVFEVVEAELTQRLGEAVDASGLTDPVELMKLGARTWLDACAEPEAHRIVLVEAPAVLGWIRWREVGLHYGLGMVQSLLSFAMEVGSIRQQPVEPLAHVLIGAIDEAALYVAQSEQPDEARADVLAVLEDLLTAMTVH
jgi:AcrR family transcriptional regulator